MTPHARCIPDLIDPVAVLIEEPGPAVSQL
jgi:hypothetical protein